MSDLFTLSIRRRLDKGDKIGTNEIRALLAMVETLKHRVEELEAKAAVVATTPTDEVEAVPS